MTKYAKKIISSIFALLLLDQALALSSDAIASVDDYKFRETYDQVTSSSYYVDNGHTELCDRKKDHPYQVKTCLYANEGRNTIIYSVWNSQSLLSYIALQRIPISERKNPYRQYLYVYKNRNVINYGSDLIPEKLGVN